MSLERGQEKDRCLRIGYLPQCPIKCVEIRSQLSKKRESEMAEFNDDRDEIFEVLYAERGTSVSSLKRIIIRQKTCLETTMSKKTQKGQL